jgi:putative endonuclease
MYFVYLLECADGSLYTGITTDVARRFEEHRKGVGGHFTRAKGAVRIVYTEEYPDRSSASSREAAIKKLSREQKVHLIAQK